MGIIAPLSSTAVLAAIPAGGITQEKMAENSIGTTQIQNLAVHSGELGESLKVVKGLSIWNVATPAAQHAAIASPAETLAALKIAVDAIREVIKEYGQTA